MPQDRTNEIQARFNAGNYDLTGFNGAGVTTLDLKHPTIHITASEPTTLFMLPLLHPTKPGFSKSVPMIHANQRVGGVQGFECIFVSDAITFNGSFPNQKPFMELNQKDADPLGLARNVFDQIVDDKNDVIKEFCWYANAEDCAGTVVSFSNVHSAWVGGIYKNIGTKVCGIAYSAAENPMNVTLHEIVADNVNSLVDFSAPPTLKDFRRRFIPYGVLQDCTATNVYGRSKCQAHWALNFNNVKMSSLPWPSPVQYSGFTVANETIDRARFTDCTFEGFLRAGLELRNTSGPVHIDGITAIRSLNGLLHNASRPCTYGAYSKFVDCKVGETVSNPGSMLEENPTVINWSAEVTAAKAKALEYGYVVNFPL